MLGWAGYEYYRSLVVVPVPEDHRITEDSKTFAMPELPEVESARRLVEAHCVGSVIEDVIYAEQGGGPRSGLFDDIVIQTESGDVLRSALIGKTLVSAKRIGKIQYFTTSDPGVSFTTHFGMTGAWSVRGQAGVAFKRYSVDTSEWPPRYTKLELVFSGGMRLALTDPRRLARITLVRAADAAAVPPLSLLGPDAWLALPTASRLFADFSAKSTAIKALLLDQNYLAGVGNWIADEVLYQAAVHPETISSALTAADTDRLHASLRSVISHACKVNADSDKFPRDWLFHYRWGKGKKTAENRMPDGSHISFVTVGGRTSAVVSAVQGSPRKLAPKSKVPLPATAIDDTEAASTAAGSKKRGRKMAATTTSAYFSPDPPAVSMAVAASSRRRLAPPAAASS
jgi:formamidopyrimidine-DNA glycosylase